jgi:hypothetical protein
LIDVLKRQHDCVLHRVLSILAIAETAPRQLAEAWDIACDNFLELCATLSLF